MRYSLIFTSFFLFISCFSYCQNRIQIVIPSIESETAYIWRTIQDISFFEKNNYQVSLPKGRLIKSLIKKAKNNRLSDKDYSALQSFIGNKIYKKQDYQAGYQKIDERRTLINQMISALRTYERNWPFKEFETYQIKLTLYGPGGSFNPDDGTILIFTTPEGSFKQYDNPAHTIIHEIVHIGIEKSLIQKFQVPHTLKERIVDLFVRTHFKKALPGYVIQDMGEKRIDPFISHVEDFKDLDQIVEKILVHSSRD